MPNVKVYGVSINPGPFTVKEHVLITIMATVGYQSAYAVSPGERFVMKEVLCSSRRTSSPSSVCITVRFTTSATSGCW